jgi:hypothetical protein
MSVHEAEQRLALAMSDVLSDEDNDVAVKIVLPETSVAQDDNLPLQRASKIALIKLVRKLAEDLLEKRLPISTRQLPGGYTEQYFGLADAKSYVETYLKDTAPRA